jgi:hypothetical protein
VPCRAPGTRESRARAAPRQGFPPSAAHSTGVRAEKSTHHAVGPRPGQLAGTGRVGHRHACPRQRAPNVFWAGFRAGADQVASSCWPGGLRTRRQRRKHSCWDPCARSGAAQGRAAPTTGAARWPRSAAAVSRSSREKRSEINNPSVSEKCPPLLGTPGGPESRP